MNERVYFAVKNKKGLQGRKISRQTCFYVNKFNEILLCRMKSKRVWMKSSPTASDEIKSASINPALAGFHPRSGFIPTKADLIEKGSELYPILSLFLVHHLKPKLNQVFSLGFLLFLWLFHRRC